MSQPGTMLVAIGCALLVAALPLALGKVPPNQWYGFRTALTLADARAWYPVNRTTGRGFAAGALTMIAAGAAMLQGALPSAPHWLLVWIFPPILLASIASGISLDRVVRQLEHADRPCSLATENIPNVSVDTREAKRLARAVSCQK